MDNIKILSAEITNFKSISKKLIQIDGRSLVILGANADGKSSFIQALLSPLDSKYIPSKPITDGEEKGSIKLAIGGEVDGIKKTYNVDLYFTPANNKGRLVIKNELGEEISPPKTFLKGLVGEIGFDIFSFLRSKPKEQVEQLKKIAGLDFTKINQERQKIYDERTYINKKIQEEEAQLKNHGFSPEQVERYSKKIDTTEIKKKINDIGSSLQQYFSVESGLKERENKSIALRSEAEKNRETIQRLEAEAAMLKEKNKKIEEDEQILFIEIGKAKQWLEKKEKADASAFNEELNKAEEHNRNVEKLEGFKAKNVELNSLKSKSEDLTEAIKKIDKSKEYMIANSKLPIPGLTFNDEHPLYNNLPLEETQINKAKLIEIGVKISMAMNPVLRTMCIWDASLLDKNSLKTVIELCEKEGYQLLLEVVDFEGGGLDIKFTEEYIL